MEKKINFWTEWSNRWTANSPIFFKKLISLGAWLTATGIGLIGVPAGLEQIIPDTANFDLSLLAKIASYMVLAGLIISVVAKLPVKDPDYSQLDKK